MKKMLFSFLILLLSLPLAPPVSAVDIPNFVELSSDLKPVVVNISTAKTVTSRRQIPNPHGFGGPGGPGGPGGEAWEDFFERFFQEKTRYEGVGVGLSICKAIMEAHGGRIWAESAGRGQGATFVLVLPSDSGETAGP